MSRLLFTFALALLFPIASIPACLANQPESEVECDLLVVGGTESGWAAAIQAARMGVKRIVLVNDIDWLGGQYTAEAVCAFDEKIADNVEWVRKLTIDDVPTESGRFHEATIEVAVVEGKLTIELGKRDRMLNTCLN